MTAATNPNPWPKTDYRMNLRNVCRLPTIIELPISEKLEEVGIEEYYYIEYGVILLYSHLYSDDGGDNVDMCNGKMQKESKQNNINCKKRFAAFKTPGLK